MDIDELLNIERKNIDEIDSQILNLLARRVSAIGKVAEIKKEHGLPVYHPAREEDLISKRRAEAKELNLDPDMVEEIYRKILRGSRITQNKTLAGKQVRPGAKVLVVGGRGSMGKTIAGWFSSAGYELRILEKDDWGNAPALCSGVDLVILAVPIDITGEIAHRIGKLISPECILSDITSVKTAPMDAMLLAHNGPVVGLHPMFGPTTTVLDKQIVVVTEGREPQNCGWLIDQLAVWGAVIVHSTAREHDEMMDVVQGLRHFATFAFGQFLCRMNVDLHRTLEFSSPIYRLEMGMVGRLFAQDADLYGEIIFSTPERRKLLLNYIESIARNIKTLESGDMEGFLAEFREISKWFGPFGDQAIRESSFLIEKMIERF